MSFLVDNRKLGAAPAVPHPPSMTSKLVFLIALLVPLHGTCETLNCAAVSAKVSVQYQLQTENGKVFPAEKQRSVMAEIAAGGALADLPRDTKLGRAARRWAKMVVLVAFERELSIEAMDEFSRQACEASFGR